MPTYILTYSPKTWKWIDYAKDVARVKAKGLLRNRWSSGSTKRIKPGDRLLLLRQGTNPGLIGSGLATSFVYKDKHWSMPKKRANYVDLEFDTLVDQDQQLPLKTLEKRVRNIHWENMPGSGVSVPESSAHTLESIWSEHLIAIQNFEVNLPDELPSSNSYLEGAGSLVLVNRYERRADARKDCINHFGFQCVVCGFDFEKVYGQLGRGYIHVHHLTDLAQIRGEYEVNPIKDLRPVCPNCHAMLHREKPAMSIEHLKRIIRACVTKRA